MAWYVLSDGSIGEIWFVGPKDDAAGLEEAAAIPDSFRSPWGLGVNAQASSLL